MKKAIQGGYISEDDYKKLEDKAAEKGLKPTPYIRMIVLQEIRK